MQSAPLFKVPEKGNLISVERICNATLPLPVNHDRYGAGEIRKAKNYRKIATVILTLVKLTGALQCLGTDAAFHNPKLIELRNAESFSLNALQFCDVNRRKMAIRMLTQSAENAPEIHSLAPGVEYQGTRNEFIGVPATDRIKSILLFVEKGGELDATSDEMEDAVPLLPTASPKN